MDPCLPAYEDETSVHLLFKLSSLPCVLGNSVFVSHMRWSNTLQESHIMTCDSPVLCCLTCSSLSLLLPPLAAYLLASCLACLYLSLLVFISFSLFLFSLCVSLLSSRFPILFSSHTDITLTGQSELAMRESPRRRGAVYALQAHVNLPQPPPALLFPPSLPPL